MKVRAVPCFRAEAVLGAADGRCLEMVRVLHPVIHILVSPVIELARSQDRVRFTAGNGSSKLSYVIVYHNMRCWLQISSKSGTFLACERAGFSRIDGVADLGAGQIKLLFQQD